jgi:hypothetical protein
VVGPDAVYAARLAGRQQPHTYDVPAHLVSGVYAELSRSVLALNMRAEVVVEPVRVPHEVRAERSATLGGATFPIGHGTAFACRQPAAAAVELHHRGNGELDAVAVRFDPAPVLRSETAGVICPDSDILIIAAPAALDGWQEHTSRDGLADVAVYGADAAMAAAVFSGRLVDDEEAVWRNLTEAAATELATEISAWAVIHAAAAAWTVRPHSDEFFMLEQLDETRFAVLHRPGGVVVAVAVESQDTCVVASDWDADGRIVGYRLALAADPEAAYLPAPTRADRARPMASRCGLSSWSAWQLVATGATVSLTLSLLAGTLAAATHQLSWVLLPAGLVGWLLVGAVRFPRGRLRAAAGWSLLGFLAVPALLAVTGSIWAALI